MDATDYFEQHEFVGSLTIAATVIPLTMAVFNLIYFADEYFLFSIMGISIYFLYFKNVNKKFADRELANDELSVALQEWGNWHRGRSFF